MAQAIMDPEKVRRFADELQRFNTDLENRLVLCRRASRRSATPGRTRSRTNSPRIQAGDEGAEKFIDLSKEHAPFLLRKAQRIEEYLHQR